MPRYFSLVYLVFALCPHLFAQQRPEDFLNLAREEQHKNNYELTLSFLNSGLQKYPQDAALYFERGNLYFSQQIYKKALSNFLNAEKYGYDSTYPLYTNIAEIYGMQGNNELAKDYYTRLVAAYPDNENATANLLWYYYKTLHIKEGIRIGEIAIAKWPQSSSINSMLALLYASLHDYNKAQYYYENAVNISIKAGRYREASQTLYNQAIFENAFYQFAKAEDLLQKAISLDSNPSSYRLLGELYLKKLQYYSAKDMVEISESLEVSEAEKIKRERTPLGRLVLAELYLVFYQLEEAEKILHEVSALTDQEWITSFGTNKDSYLAWLYNLQAKLWKKYLIASNRQICPSPTDWVLQQIFRIKALFFHFYYESMEHSFGLKVANTMFHKQLILPAYRDYANLAQSYPQVERHFINMSQQIELAFAPNARPSYLAEMSLLENSPILRDTALQEFDPLYERYKQQVLLEKWLQKNYTSRKILPLIIRLYDLNRAAVVGYGLPTILHMQGDKLYTNVVEKLLKKNLIITKNTPYTMYVEMDQGVSHMSLYKNDTQILSQTLEYKASRQGLIDLANRLLFYLYFPVE